MISISGLKIRLAKLETRLQRLVEGSAARLFRTPGMSDDLAARLVSAMQTGLKHGAGDTWIAPNLYLLSVNPDYSQELRQQYQLLDDLAYTLQAAAAESEVSFLSPPVIRIAEDRRIPLHQIEVSALISLENLDQTSDMIIETGLEVVQPPTNAFLIVNGMQTYPLVEKVVNIGRRSDNQIIVLDGRVSRVHAQLRLIKGRYAIFDLNSTGGTFINGQAVLQCVLFPGDVISLGGVPLVFGQDESGLEDTQQLPGGH